MIFKEKKTVISTLRLCLPVLRVFQNVYPGIARE